MSKKRLSFFITGIAGFIGFHLAIYLKKRGAEVMGCDNFYPYYPVVWKKERTKQLQLLGIPVLTCDIGNLSRWKPLFQKKRFSHFVHLAAQAGVRYSLHHPHAYGKANLDGMLHILEICRTFYPIQLVFASSSSVYGNQEGSFSEEDRTDMPVSLYAATKKAGEMLARSYYSLYQIPTIVLRFFTVYGPWGRPDMAYFSFAKAILEGEPISLFNQGEMVRDFTYIGDIIDGIVSAIDHCKEGYALYNLGSGKKEKLSTLVTLLENYLGKKANISMQPMQAGDVKQTWAKVTKAEKDFGFRPRVNLKEGISRFASWYLQNYHLEGRKMGGNRHSIRA